MMTDSDTYFMIDTNVLVYALDPSEELKNRLAAELVDEFLLGNKKAAVSTQVMSEVYNVFFTKAKATEIGEVERFITSLAKIPRILKLVVKPRTVLKAMRISRENEVNYYDSLIAATMLENGITKIYTEDDDFGKIRGIDAVNPFIGSGTAKRR